MANKIVVHHSLRTRGIRAVWLMEELKVPYEIKMYPYDEANFKADPALKKVHRAGKIPAVTDADGTVVGESGLILEYFAEKYRENTDLWADSKTDVQNIKYDLYSGEANFMTAECMVIANAKARQTVPMGISFLLGSLLDYIESRWAGPELRQWLDLLEEQIAENKGFCTNGHFTVADIMYETNIMLLERFKPSYLKDYPKIMEWYHKMHERPGYKAAQAHIEQAAKVQLA